MNKSPKENKPYTYLVGWSKLGFWYYGVRYSKNCFPSDLWVSYYTSSKKVKEFREKFGEPDVVEIRRTFADRESAIDWEHRVLRRIGAVKSEKWLNRFDGKAVHPDDALRGAKQKKPNRKRLDAAEKERRRIAAIADGRASRLNTEDSVLKRIAANKTRIASMTPEERASLTIAMNTPTAKAASLSTRVGNLQNMTPEERAHEKQRRSTAAKLGKDASTYSATEDHDRNAKISASKKENNPNFKSVCECPHCGKRGQYAALKRWHFDSCKDASSHDQTPIA
jgi:hypothetical protein